MSLVTPLAPVASWPPAPMSLAALIGHQARTAAQQSYLEHGRGGAPLTYGALEETVAATRLWLAGRVRPGALVALSIADPVELAVVLLAVVASGRWAAPLDPRAPAPGPAGMAATVERLRPDLVVADRPAPD
ncbi:MAG: hypothetical protein ACRDY1_06900, partial [Acidimicrobiales bacterium]